MSRGYITTALNSKGVDYIRMAYCLSLSLAFTQSNVNKLSVVVENKDDVPARYRDGFDHIIELPSRDASTPDGWRVENYHQLYWATPYQETVTLDADMLFFDDVSSWWDDMARKDIVAATRVLNYRGEIVDYNPLRESFYQAGLPDVHNGYLYFKQCNKIEQLFTTMKRFTFDWEATGRQYLGQAQTHYSSDAALVTSLRAVGLEEECQNTDLGGIPRFVHMKTCIQGWPNAVNKDWRTYVTPVFKDDLSLEIGGYRISDPMHYHLRDFITDDLLERYERKVNK